MCRHCHKNCKLKLNHSITNSLKVQHSQASPNRCCQSINNSSSNSQKSASSTLTGGCSSSQLSKEALHSRTSFTNHGPGSDKDTNKDKESLSDDKKSLLSDTPCNCKCTPDDFKNMSTNHQELKKETCKLVNSVAELNLTPSRKISVYSDDIHKNCHCSCTDKKLNDRSYCQQSKTPTGNVNVTTDSATDEVDDWSLMLIGLAQIHPTTKLVQVDPFETLPTISVVPPTPEGLIRKPYPAPLWDDTKLNLDNLKKTKMERLCRKSPENSPDDSPQDEEPPYTSLNTSLKR